MKKLNLSLAIILSAASVHAQGVYYEDAKSTGNFDETIIEHSGFVISYNETTKMPNWAAFEFNGKNYKASTGTAPVKVSFTADPLVKPAKNAQPSLYSNSGYVRGQMVFPEAMKYSREAYKEAFYMTNICPMDPKFTEQMWDPVREKIRSYVKKYGTAYICTGPIFLDLDNVENIYMNGLRVPTAFFVCVAQERDGLWFGLGLVLPNTVVKKQLSKCQFPIADIGELTGIEFFHNLPDEVRYKVINQKDPNSWGLNF